MQIQVRSELADLVAKAEAGERLSRADGRRLQRSHDLMTIGYMADLVRRQTVGDFVCFVNGGAGDASVEAVLESHTDNTPEDQVDRMIALRNLQDETGRLLCRVPVERDPAYHHIKVWG